jgi:hypothetical protein
MIFLLFPTGENAGHIAENLTGSWQHCALSRPEHLGGVLPFRAAEEQDPGLLQQDPPYTKGRRHLAKGTRFFKKHGKFSLNM